MSPIGLGKATTLMLVRAGCNRLRVRLAPLIAPRAEERQAAGAE
jgi:hypothetical protein